MSLSRNIGSYNDCFTYFDRALADRVGIRFRCGTDHGRAKHMVMRMHQARSLLRKQNKRVYSEQHPNFGTSPYDSQIVRLRGPDASGFWWIHIENIEGSMDIVESLEFAEGIVIPGNAPAKQIEHEAQPQITHQPQYEFDEQSCPGHIASDDNGKICARCGIHIDSLRPFEDDFPDEPEPNPSVEDVLGKLIQPAPAPAPFKRRA